MKLNIELIPTTAYGQNLRNMSPNAWQEISRTIRNNANGICEICGRNVGVENLDAHEVWKYSKKKVFVPYLGKKRYVQSLKDIQAICKDCHAVKHIGYTKHNGNYKKAKKWFRKINNCDKEIFNEAERNAYIKYNKRSQYKWYLLIDNEKLYSIINKKGKSKI